MSVMDFYHDALLFITKLHATLDCVTRELSDVLKPHDNMMSTLLESQVYEEALQQYREMQSFLLGEHEESKGHQYVESESVVGSSDKMMFYMKEMVSEFN